MPRRTSPPRSADRRPGTLRRALASGLATAATLGLVLLHLGLLWSRLADLSLWRPEVGLRWLGALLLLGAGALHRRRGHSLLRGRGALALWILVLLLHAGSSPATARPLPPSGHPPEAPRLLWALPLALAAVAFSLAAAIRRTPALADPAAANRLRDRRAAAASALAPRALDAPRPPPFSPPALAHL
ncbi:MAG TPA: hypothetical protein PLT41_01815 [Thermoanaerobaculia bacterium]|nr:hypothetical protein [Thermoanaerobaculia bacterium]